MDELANLTVQSQDGASRWPADLKLHLPPWRRPVRLLTPDERSQLVQQLPTGYPLLDLESDAEAAVLPADVRRP